MARNTKKVHNSVVQIFAIAAIFDWLEPYKTPQQTGGCGSGFFINSDGDIVTNAHVIDEAVAVWVCIPELGKMPLRVEIISTCPASDLALLRLDKQSKQVVEKMLGTIPYLPIGDSDTINKTDEVLTAGYPLGQRSLKFNTGIFSGTWHALLQIDAPMNPGNSGGPLFNCNGEVIGINSSGFVNAQNVNYAIPSNILTMRLPEMYEHKLLKTPWFGTVTIPGSVELTDYLGNPQPGGAFLCNVITNSFVDKLGIQANDMIYEINGYPVDIYGDITVPWSEDKIGLSDFLTRLSLGQEVSFLIYRNGTEIRFTAPLEIAGSFAVNKKYPWYEIVDYEVFAGMVVMDLTINHIEILGERVPFLKLYSTLLHQNEPHLVITNIFPDALVAQQPHITVGSTINEVNGWPVSNVAEFRQAVAESAETGILTVRTTDEISRVTDNVFVVLSFEEMCEETVRLAELYRYPISDFVESLLN